MKISTRGRYALRLMVDLAEHPEANCISLKDISERQGISLKYLESIVSGLVRSGLLDSVHGKGGGYRLNRAPGDYKVGEILRIAEGDLAPVSCEACSGEQCSHIGECKTKNMWDTLGELINNYLDGISLADLLAM